MKKLLAALTAALLLTPALPVSAAEDVRYTLTDGVLTVSGTGALTQEDASGWQDKSGEITAVIVEDGVTALGSGVFKDCTSLQRITLPPSLTQLGPEALSGCTKLKTIEGLEHVTEFDFRCLTGTAWIAQTPFVIRDGALYYAEGTDLEVPEGVTKILPFAFGNLTGERFGSAEPCVITLPEGVEVIGDYAFAYCTSVTEVNIPETVTEIGDYAFFDCAALREIELGDRVMSVGDYAFWNCRSLEQMTVWSRQITFGTEAVGTVVNWDAVMQARLAEGQLTAVEVEALKKLSQTRPLIYDSLSAYTAVHLPQTHSYSELMRNPLVREGTQEMWMHTGLICGIPGTDAQTYAEAQGVDFVPVEVLRGDCDLDGKVDLLDVIALNKNLLGVMPLSSRARYAADMNEDGTPDSADSLTILRHTVHLD